jgi:hypothetical protein
LAEAQPFVRAASPSASFSTPQGSASSPGAAQNPEELFLGLARLCKPDWASRFRPPAPTTFASRAQNALTLGGVFADVLLAASAEDVQQSKNLSKDILALARPLGVQTELLDHSKSLVDCAERHDWGGLRREMETTRAELEGTLRKHADDDLIALLTLGAWMRATEVVASLVCERYSPETASLLRQPVAAQVVRERTASLSEKLQTDPTVTRIRSRLAELERLLAAPPLPPPSPEEARALSELAASLLGDINLKRN